MADDSWLEDFHAGRRSTLERCYVDHRSVVDAAVRRVVKRGADAETVVHEVFYRLLSNAELRANFQGGNFAAWIARVATNQAIDYQRRYNREAPIDGGEPVAPTEGEGTEATDELDAKRLVDRFRSEVLPAKWQAVFDARFIRQLGQYETARELGIYRSTLVYQEHRIRAMLREFVLQGGET